MKHTEVIGLDHCLFCESSEEMDSLYSQFLVKNPE